MSADKEGDKVPSLHDWLAIGEFEKALAPDKRQDDEIHRLPLLLRMLSASQPLSSIPAITKTADVSPEDEESSDPLVDEVVSRLEDVAATYSAAEGVDALTSYYAPSTCRKISRLAPLKRDEQGWKTQDLASVAASPVDTSPRKRRRPSETLPSSVQTGDDNEIQGDEVSDDDMSVEAVPGQEPISMDFNPTDGVTVRAVIADSQEAMTTKCLTELSSLVVESLAPIKQNKDDEEATFSNLALSLTSDSLLSEPASTLDASGSAGAVGGCDLGATVSGLMHHSPVLRHRHVAAALCRAAAPQAAVLISRMGANCPSAVPCLLQGCIDAYTSAVDAAKFHAGIANASKAGVKSLARLSIRESYRSLTLLQQANVMIDVQLELAIGQDPITAACIVSEHLSRCAIKGQEDEAGKDTNLQPPSETPMYSRPNKRMRSYQQTASEDDRAEVTSLNWLLRDNTVLFGKTFHCLLDALDENIGPCTLIFLRALTFLFLFGADWNTDCISSGLVMKACQKLVLLQSKVGGEAGSNVIPAISDKDQYFRQLLCACLVTSARAATVSQASEVFLRETAESCLGPMLRSSPISLQSDVFLSRVAGALKALCGDLVGRLILEVLKVSSFTKIDDCESAFLQTCRMASADIDLETAVQRGTTDVASLHDLSALLQSVELDGCYERVDDFVKTVLSDSLRCGTVMNSVRVCDLIKASVAALSKEGGNKLPCVLPIQLQSDLALKMDWRDSGRDSQPYLERKFLLQLLYCLYFLEQHPMSPFAIDPREFPLKEALQLARSFSTEIDGHSYVAAELEYFITKVAPEAVFGPDPTVVHGIDMGIQAGSTYPSIQTIRRAFRSALSNSIRTCKSGKNEDSSGCMAERTFLFATRQLTQSEADTIAAGALLALPNSPLPFITYAALCRDPLALFKAPITVWRCKGLRRITLTVLSRTLDANENNVNTSSCSEEAASELLSSRDAVVITCLIMATIKSANRKECVDDVLCPMTLAMIRGIIAKRVGLVALLVKQGQNDALVDFLVDYVPESMHDAQSLITLLSDRSSLTAAEKLVTADASLRISIAHGQRDESTANTLAYAALSRLLSSFFLVIGPVGVPVNSLGEENGMDVTQKCRKALFRMLSALQNVHGGREGLRKECSLALQKLAGLCKGESIMNGVAGTVASLRQKLLKDIYNAVVKAANAMGACL